MSASKLELLLLLQPHWPSMNKRVGYGWLFIIWFKDGSATISREK
jgi:hypothetical protein